MSNSSPKQRRRRGGFAASLLNIITAVLVTAAVFALLFFMLLALAPQLLPETISGRFPTLTEREEIIPPTLIPVAEAPTLTPTPTETPVSLLQATWTPASAAVEPTSTFPPLNTLAPLSTHTPAATLPPSTPTRTATPTPTETATPGPSPTVTNTRSPFQFTKTNESPFYLQNFANTAGCEWMGIAGEVVNLNGQPVPSRQFRVHVWDNVLNLRAWVGDAPDYGPSGWEQFLSPTPQVLEYNVQLETANGTPVSQVYRVQSRASCNQNLIMFNFVQNY
jgi:hypothetical protein